MNRLQLIKLLEDLIPVVREPEEDDEPQIIHMDGLEDQINKAVRTLKDEKGYAFLLEEGLSRNRENSPPVASCYFGWLEASKDAKPDEWLWDKDITYIEIAALAEAKTRKNVTLPPETFWRIMNQSRRAMSLYRSLSEIHRMIANKEYRNADAVLKRIRNFAKDTMMAIDATWNDFWGYRTKKR